MAENMKYLAQEIKELTLGTPPWHRGEYKVKKGFFKDSHIITVATAGGYDRFYIDREYHTFKFSSDAAKLKILGESLVDFIQNYETR